jgi:hypothetical protein
MANLKAPARQISSKPRPPSVDASCNVGTKIVSIFDPFGIGKAFVRLQSAWLQHPREFTAAAIKLSGGLEGLLLHSLNRAIGLERGGLDPRGGPG